MFKKLFKPWFINNPLLIVRAFLFDVGVAPRGWSWVKTCFCMPIYCDTSKAIGCAIYKNGVYELPTSELVWRLLKDSPNALFVDVGANIGYYSLLARKRLGNDGVVVAFEPLPDIHEKLIMNLHGMNVSAHQYAVSSSNGQATLSIPKGSDSNDGISTLQDCVDAIDSITVQTISLDDFLDKEIHILKIDVEGHEYDALLGAKSLLARGKIRNIIFEDHDIEHSAVVTLLTSFGYKIFSIGWDRVKLILKPLGEPNSSYVQDAPNYIATLDVAHIEAATQSTGWSVLSGI
jgi:FkbM family methyltransferase